MKRVSKLTAVLLALAMCLSLLPAAALAASFEDLQAAINGTDDKTDAAPVEDAAPADEYVSGEPADSGEPAESEEPADSGEPAESGEPVESKEPAEPEEPDTTHVNGALVREEDSTKYYGYAWSKQDDGKWYYGIEAWNDGGTRNVQINETVTRGDKERGITVKSDVTLDLNGQKIVDEKPETYGRTIDVKSGSTLTVDDRSDEKTGVIQGNQYAIFASGKGIEVNIEGGSVTGEQYGLYLGEGAHSTVSGENTAVKGNAIGVFANGKGTEVNIEGGSVTGKTGLLVQVGAKGTVSGENTTVKGTSYGVRAAWVGTEVKIEGGSVTGGQYGFQLQDGAHGTVSGENTTVKGTSIGVFADGGPNEVKTEVGIEGGSVTGGKRGLQVQNGAKGTISGGSVSAENGGDGVCVRSYGAASSQVTKTGGDISGNVVLFSDKTGDGTSEFTVGGVTYSLSAKPSEEEPGKQVITIAVKDAGGNPIGDTATTVTVEIGTKFMPVLNTANTDNPRFELSEDMLDTTAVKTNGYGGYVDNTGFHPYPAPAIPGGGTEITGGDITDTGTGDDDTAIEDGIVPLALMPTRGELMGYLYERAGSPAAESSTFTDVPADHMYAAAIGWAQQNGIAIGYADGTFDPDNFVLAGDMAAFLTRYAAFAGMEMPALATMAALKEDDIVDNADAVLAEFFGEE